MYIRPLDRIAWNTLDVPGFNFMKVTYALESGDSSYNTPPQRGVIYQ